MVKNPLANSGNMGSIPGLGQSPRVGNSNPFPNSFMENSMHRGAWQATVHGVTEPDMTEQLSTQRNVPKDTLAG